MKSIFRSIAAKFRRRSKPAQKKLLADQRGIALLMVLSTLMVLTVALVEFTYSTRVNYRMAVHAKERLQAYYLAKSALNFSKIILMYSKEIDTTKQKAEEKLGEPIQIEPIYRMMPLSSSLLRGVLSSGGLDGLTGGEGEGEEAPAPAEGEKGKEEAKPDVSLVDKQEMEKFLSFDGDFSAEITEEQTKFDLNMFESFEKQNPNYDFNKKLLLSILKMPEFEDLFENPAKDAADLTHALADWVDTDNMVNEFDQIQRGGENSAYAGQDYKPRNGKFLTLSELRLVAGMNDALYQALLPYVTIYSKKSQMNICLGNEEMVKALIYHYTHFADCTAPIEYEDSKMPELVSAILAACPDVDGMVAALNTALNVGDLPTQTTEDTPPPTPCNQKLKSFLTTDNNVFTIKATGTVDETEVSLITVINTEPKDPDKWTQYYFRIE